MQPLLDTRKLRDYLGISQGPIDLMYQYRRGIYGPVKRLMVLGETEGEMNEEYEMTKIQLTDVNVEGKTMFIEGEYTLEKLGDFTFTASYSFDRNLVAMSSLPHLNHNKLLIKTDDKFKKLTKNNTYRVNESFRKLIKHGVLGYLNDAFDNVEEYAGDYMRTGPRLSRDKNLESDKRGKQERFKEVLRKPDSSNARQFLEIMNKPYEEFYTVLPVDEEIVKKLVEKGLLDYDESALGRNTFPYRVTKMGEDMDIKGVSLSLYADESMNENEPSIRIKDRDGEYNASFYASFDDRPIDKIRGEVSSAERQKVIDDYKAFKKMTGKQILDEILGM